jgi:hypothetical protein
MSASARAAIDHAEVPAPGHDRAWFAGVSTFLLAVVALPWLIAVFHPPAGLRSWGAIWYAPDDSLLLSVIQEGMRGHWLHRPPYALAEGPGALFYPLHLLVGHLCRWTGMNAATGLHLARLACGALMLAALAAFVGRFFAGRGERRFAFLLAATGCGLGWLPLLAWGIRSPELSTSEAYPFFAALASLHLAFAIAAMLWTVDALVPRAGGGPRWWRVAAGALALAATQPFGVVVAGAIGAAWAAVRLRRERRVPWDTLGGLVLLGGLSAPFVLHQVISIATNPAYVGWRTQVSTPTPTLGEVLIGVGLALPFALAGLVEAARRRDPGDVLLLAWIGAMVVLMSLPYYQARRFDLAGYVPLVILAVRGLRVLRLDGARTPGALAVMVNALTSLFILGASLARVTSGSPEVYVPRATWEAFAALRQRAPEGAVVLARPLTSLALLAAAPVRAVYGHPAETPDAAATHAAVDSFFRSGMPLPPRLADRVDYVLVEPGTPGTGALAAPPGFREVYAMPGAELWERATVRPTR